MGRGRAKAKQQKVARELKYNSQSTDLDALQRELGGTTGHGSFGSHDSNGHSGSNGAVSPTPLDDELDDPSGEYDDRWTGTR
jgi:hypothetical protein